MPALVSVPAGLGVGTAKLAIDDQTIGFGHEYTAAHALDHTFWWVQIWGRPGTRLCGASFGGIAGISVVRTARRFFRQPFEQHPSDGCYDQRKNYFAHKYFQKTRLRMLTEAACERVKPQKLLPPVIFRQRHVPPRSVPAYSYCLLKIRVL